MVSALAARHSRAASLAGTVIFDVGGPLAVYYALSSAGASTLVSLVASGVLPATGIGLGVVRSHRLDAVGALVLTGIVVGAVVGLASGNPHLVLLDGTVPTFVFGVIALGSLWTARPLIFRLALQWMGPDTPRGPEFASYWRYPGFRHAFKVMTVVWGVAFLTEAAVQIVVIESAPVSLAKTTSNLLPLGFAAVVIAWNVLYSRRGRRLLQSQSPG